MEDGVEDLPAGTVSSPTPGRPSPSWLQADCCLQARPWSFWRTFVTSTTISLAEGFIYKSNLTKLLVGIQEDDILHSTSFPEIPGFLFYLFHCSQGFIITFRGLPGLKLATTISRFFLITCTIDFKLPAFKFQSQIHFVWKSRLSREDTTNLLRRVLLWLCLSQLLAGPIAASSELLCKMG